ncbi:MULTISPECIES: hypothetical protein [Yersinia]|nr:MULTISPECIES: hypothetical protein [Yersinia]CQJ10835.1 Uncharacterised protein [Yersinia mollaretii]MBW5838664.1 hypothetical protein [Yersinia enterocolitica]MCW8110121.1 hypothetical protein [Yersinia intermedia]MDA5515159.1 hypothetical protein [Yersinia intermedia]OWF90410.1 hypothetical protein B4916_15655 [Yersinia intermedia]
MQKTILRISADSILIANAAKIPALVEIGASPDAIMGTVSDLIDSGIVDVRDLISLALDQIKKCDSVSLNHVLPNDKLIELTDCYYQIKNN